MGKLNGCLSGCNHIDHCQSLSKRKTSSCGKEKWKRIKENAIQRLFTSKRIIQKQNKIKTLHNFTQS